MYCHNCNSFIEDGSVFCPECGAQINSEGPGNGKVYQISSNHSIKLNEAFLKYIRIRKRFESLSAKDSVQLEMAMNKEMEFPDKGVFINYVCVQFIPDIGNALLRQVKEASTVLGEYGIKEIPDTRLWEIIFNKINIYKTFIVVFHFLEFYHARIAAEIPINGFCALRKYSLYYRLLSLMKSKQYDKIFIAVRDVKHSLDKINVPELPFDFSTDECFKTAARVLKEDDRESLFDSIEIINNVSELLSEYVTDILHKNNILELPKLDLDKSQKIYNSDGINLFIPKDDRVNALCRCLELYPYHLDYYRDIYTYEISARKGLLELAKETGLIELLLPILHEVDANRSYLEFEKYKRPDVVFDDSHRIAYNQGDLEYVLESRPDIIYLYNGEYTIPLKYHNIHYSGLGKVTVKFDSSEKIDFKNLKISFDHVTFDERYQKIETKDSSDAEMYSNARKAMAESNYEQALYYYEEAANKGNADALYELGLIYKFKKPFSENNIKKAKKYFRKAVSAGSKFAIVEKMIFENKKCESLAYKERIMQLIQNHIEEFRNAYDYGGEFAFIPDISPKKLSNAIGAYGNKADIDFKDVLFLYDSTIMGTGRDGFMLTHEGFICGDSEGNYRIIPLSDIDSLEYDDDHSFIGVNIKELASLKLYPHEKEDKSVVLSQFSSSRRKLFVNLFNKMVFYSGYRELLPLQLIDTIKAIDEKLYREFENLNLIKMPQNQQKQKMKSNKALERKLSSKEKVTNNDETYLLAKKINKKNNFTEALKNFKLAAEQGDTEALTEIGNLYFSGKGVKKDYTEARKWYAKAAEKGEASAQNQLGVMYFNGFGVNKDYTEARKWYAKAAIQGNANSQYFLGYIYSQGLGVSKDYNMAHIWYLKSAEQGFSLAQNNLGHMYLQGIGVSKNYDDAFNWFNKAAEQGLDIAQYHLGTMYSCGYGVKQDLTQAKNYYQKAANQGMKEAKEALEYVLKSKEVLLRAGMASNEKKKPKEYVEEFNTEFDGFLFDSVAEKNYVKKTIRDGILNIQAKYPGLKETEYADTDYFLDSLNLPCIDDIITFLENVAVDPEKTKVLKYIEDKKKFYIPLRNKMKELADKKSIDDVILKIQANYPDIVDNAYSNRSYFLSSLNFKFIDEIIASLQAVSVKPENTTLIEYIESKKNFYLPLRKEMEVIADKRSVDDGILKIQATYPDVPRNAYSDKEYFIDSLNLPYINDIISFLESVTVEPEKTHKLDYVNEKMKFYLPLRKEMEDTAAECKEIYQIVNKDVFSTNAEELNSWNTSLSKKEYHTEKATEIIERVRLLSSYSQKDFDFYNSVVSVLPKGTGIKTVDVKNFISIQKEFITRVKDNEIILCYTGNGFGAWTLTTQRFYISNIYYNLADILTVVNFDKYLLAVAKPEGSSLIKKTYLHQTTLEKEQLADIAQAITSVCHMYLEKNLPATSSKLLTYEYYFYNDILQQLQTDNEIYYFKGIYDGNDSVLNDSIREITGNESIILKYVNGTRCMALTDTGLIGKTEKLPKLQFKWEQLANAEITVKKSFFSKDELIINGTIYSMGNSDAKTEDWAYYLNEMIQVYKECIMNYSAYIHKIQSLPNFPPLKDIPTLNNIEYIPPKQVPTPSDATPPVTERPNAKTNKKAAKGSLFSSFTSSFMSSSKSAFDKLKDVSTKASESVFTTTEEKKNNSTVKTARAKACPKCGSILPHGSKFCGKCGAKYPTTRKCPSCGAEVEENMKFCGMCGAKMEAEQSQFCPKCGTKVPPGSKFCGKCGSKV